MDKRFKVLVLMLLLSSALTAQTIVKSHFTDVVNCHQKKGCQLLGDGIKQDFDIRYSDNELSWRKSIFEGWITSVLRKKTEDYVIGLSDELYTFADLKARSIYYIEFYRESYQVWGYGPDSEKVEQDLGAMMDLLIDKKTQKDVMQFLIDQTELSNE